ncbi:hypothetical protein Efla_001860 [Eimeria flavescens]
MEEHRLAVPLCALEVASSELSTAGPTGRPAVHRSTHQPMIGKLPAISTTAEACSEAVNSDLSTSAVSASCLPLVPEADLKGEGGQRSAATSSAATRRSSALVHAEGGISSTSPDGSYISSPFFTGSPMEFPESLQPRANMASDVQCSLSTPLEKFFDVLETTDTPVATPSPLTTVCTHHTNSPAADAFPLNGAVAQEADLPQEADKTRAAGPPARVSSSEGFSSSSAFPIRPSDPMVQKSQKEQQRQSAASSRRPSSHDETSRTTTCAGSSDAGLPAASGVTRGAFPQDKPVSADEAATSDADRLLVDFQLLLILLFDQVCNVVPGLRRQDGGAFYSMHLQRIAAGPLHPTLASYADVLLPICSAMNFFSEGSSADPRKQKPAEQESILAVALRYLARHGTIPAAPIADMVAKCPAAVFIQVVSALECMYSLQRILAPGRAEPRDRVSAELDPKTIWGDAVAEVEKAAGVLAEECVSTSVPPRAQENAAISQLPSAGALEQPTHQPKRPRNAAGSEATSGRKQHSTPTPSAKHEADSENRATIRSPTLLGLPMVDLNGGVTSVAAAGVSLPRGAAEGALLPSASRGDSSPAFISASVNKRRHPNVQAEILNSCCPERLAQRGTRLLGEVLQKLQCEQAMRPACSKTLSPKQPLGVPLGEQQPEGLGWQHDVGGGLMPPEGESDSFSSGSARGKRKLSAVGEHALGDALSQLSTPQQVAAGSPTPPDFEDLQADNPSDSQLKKHGYGLRKGAAKKGRRALEEGAGRSHGRLTPVKSNNPQQTRSRTTGTFSPSEGSQQDASDALPPNLTEQLMRLAKGADGDFPAALSSTMRGVFFNRSLNRWVCTWSRNGKEYQRSWSAGKYGYETARGLAMHCRLEKLLSGEAHTLQKGMLAVFKPVINSQVSPPGVDSAAITAKAEPGTTDEPERRKPEAAKPRASARPSNKAENAGQGVECQLGGKKAELAREATAASRPHSSSTYSDMLTLMSQAISRNPDAFSFEGEATQSASKSGSLRDKDEIKELGDPSVGEHFLAAVAAAAAVCDVPGFED